MQKIILLTLLSISTVHSTHTGYLDRLWAYMSYLTGRTQTSLSDKTIHSDTRSAYTPNQLAPLNDLEHFVNKRLEFITGKLDRINNNLPTIQEGDIEFVLAPDLTQEAYEKQIAHLTSTLLNFLNSKINDQENLLGAKKKLSDLLDHIVSLQRSIGNVYLRISLPDETDQDFYTRFSNHLNNLERFNAKKTDAYELFGLSKENRHEITSGDINQKYDELTKTNNLAQDETLQGKAIRQAHFELSDPYGKRNYDAYLDGPEFLAMLKISEESAQQFGINFQEISSELSTYKNTIDQALKVIQSQINSLDE